MTSEECRHILIGGEAAVSQVVKPSLYPCPLALGQCDRCASQGLDGQKRFHSFLLKRRWPSPNPIQNSLDLLFCHTGLLAQQAFAAVGL